MRRPTPPETCLGVALAAGAVLAVCAAWHLAAAAQAWLAAYLFWVGLPVGALFLVLVHGLTGGAWGLTLRPALAALLRMMPLTALFLVPVLLGVRRIYPWAGDAHKIWLDLPFFMARAVVYVVLWNALALGALRRAPPDGWLPPGFAWSALIALFASTSLAAFDWLMSLEPGWTSTIFGLLVTAGWVLGAMAAAVAAASRYVPPEESQGLDAPARILLALLMLWAYLSVIQLIVIWESDLPREIPWYLRRVAGGWAWVALGLAIFEFAVPFLILIWRPLRRSQTMVTAAAGTIFAAHLAEAWWLSVPDFPRSFGWLDPLAMIGMGAAFLFVIARDFDERLAAAGSRHAGD